jgi:hypothetical protein
MAIEPWTSGRLTSLEGSRHPVGDGVTGRLLSADIIMILSRQNLPWIIARPSRIARVIVRRRLRTESDAPTMIMGMVLDGAVSLLQGRPVNRGGARRVAPQVLRLN